MKLKKISCGVLSAMIVLSCNSAFAANDSVTVKLNDQTLNFDVNPVIEDGRTLVPFRKIFEELGCAVSYQEDSEGMIVTARRGADLISLRVGQYDMEVDFETKKLDVAPKIIDGRTLVPLRAISEALDCKVEWDNETRTVDISSKQGQYRIKTQNITKIIRADDGTTIMSIDCSYPVIENDDANEFCDYINKEYKEQAEKYVKEVEEQWTSDAKETYSEMSKEYFDPLTFNLYYNVTLNRNNMLSITTYDYSYTNGPHPNIYMDSRTFQMLMEKELSLQDILGCEQEKVDTIVKDAFEQWFEIMLEENADTDLTEIRENLEKEIHNVEFQLTDDELGLYFNRYQIAIYAMGVPSASIPYTGPDGIVKIDLSGANLDKVEFELDGNPTTGYDWGIVESDPEVVKVESEYVPDNVDNDIVGAGGKYKFVITGVGEGNCTVKFSYMRSWEAKERALKTIEYDLYVNAENKITIINTKEVENDGIVTVSE